MADIKKQFEIIIQADKSISALAKLEKNINDAKNAISDFDKAANRDSEAIARNKELLSALQKEYKAISDQLQSQARSYAAAKGSVAEMNDELKVLVNTYNSLEKAERTGVKGTRISERVGTLKKEIDEAQKLLNLYAQAETPKQQKPQYKLSSLNGLKERLGEIKKAYEELSSTERDSAKGELLSRCYAVISKEIEKAETKLNEFNKTLAKPVDPTSIDGMKKYVAELNALYNAMSKAERNSDFGRSVRLEQQISQRQLDNALGKGASDRTSLESYKQQLKEVEKEISNLGKTQIGGQWHKMLLNEQKELRAEIEKTKKALEETATAPKGSLDQLSQKLSEIRQKFAQLTSDERSGDKGKDLARQYADVKKQIDAADESLNKFTRDVQQPKAGSIDALNQKIERLRREYNSLSEAERKSTRGKVLIKHLQQTQKELDKTQKKVSTLSGSGGTGKLGNIAKMAGIWAAGFTTIGQMFASLGKYIQESFKKTIEFEHSISGLAAILGTTRGEIKLLTEQARVLGETTIYTAKQVIELQTELAKLGFSQSSIVSMSKSVITLAQAMGSDLAATANLTGVALRTFGLDASDTGRAVDVMAAAVTNSGLTFDYIKTSLPIVGAAAEGLGYTLEDTLAILGELANSGLSASMSATALRNIFMQLSDSNSKLVQTIGKTPKSMKELLKALRELQDRGANLNDILNLTSKRMTVAFSRMLKDSETIERISDALENADGAAAKMAETMEDNLQGSMTRMASAWDGLWNRIFSGDGAFQQGLRSATDKLTEWFNDWEKKMRTLQESVDAGISQKTTERIEGTQFDLEKYRDIKDLKDSTEKYLKEGYGITDAVDKSIADLVSNLMAQYKNLMGSGEGSITEAVDLSNKILFESIDANKLEVKRRLKATGNLIDPFYNVLGHQRNIDEMREFLAEYDKYATKFAGDAEKMKKLEGGYADDGIFGGRSVITSKQAELVRNYLNSIDKYTERVANAKALLARMEQAEEYRYSEEASGLGINWSKHKEKVKKQTEEAYKYLAAADQTYNNEYTKSLKDSEEKRTQTIIAQYGNRQIAIEKKIKDGKLKLAKLYDEIVKETDGKVNIQASFSVDASQIDSYNSMMDALLQFTAKGEGNKPYFYYNKGIGMPEAKRDALAARNIDPTKKAIENLEKRLADGHNDLTGGIGTSYAFLKDLGIDVMAEGYKIVDNDMKTVIREGKEINEETRKEWLKAWYDKFMPMIMAKIERMKEEDSNFKGYTYNQLAAILDYGYEVGIGAVLKDISLNKDNITKWDKTFTAENNPRVTTNNTRERGRKMLFAGTSGNLSDNVVQGTVNVNKVELDKAREKGLITSEDYNYLVAYTSQIYQYTEGIKAYQQALEAINMQKDRDLAINGIDEQMRAIDNSIKGVLNRREVLLKDTDAYYSNLIEELSWKNQKMILAANKEIIKSENLTYEQRTKILTATSALVGGKVTKEEVEDNIKALKALAIDENLKTELIALWTKYYKDVATIQLKYEAENNRVLAQDYQNQYDALKMQNKNMLAAEEEYAKARLNYEYVSSTEYIETQTKLGKKPIDIEAEQLKARKAMYDSIGGIYKGSATDTDNKLANKQRKNGIEYAGNQSRLEDANRADEIAATQEKIKNLQYQMGEIEEMHPFDWEEIFETVHLFEILGELELKLKSLGATQLDKDFNRFTSSTNQMSDAFGEAANAIDELGGESEKSKKTMRALLIMQSIGQAVASMSGLIYQAATKSKNFYEAIACVAAATATGIATIAQIRSYTKKFAKGAINIQGGGTETSDSIPARLSRGESVMTAKATKMFGGLLYAMNQVATQPNVTLPTSYVGYNPVQTNATNEQISQSFNDAVRKIHPVVSVTEIDSVTERKSRIKALDNF